MRSLHKVRTVGATVLAVGLAALVTAGCGSSSSKSGGSAKGTYTFWDPYEQDNSSSSWAKLVSSCGQKAGVTVKRKAQDATNILN